MFLIKLNYNLNPAKVVLFFCLIFFASCQGKPELKYSAVIVIKGREVKMTIYGPYYDVINQTTELDNVLNKIHKNHSAKTVLIRILPLKNYKNDNLFTEYTISKVTSYFDLKNINYEIRDER